MGRGRLAFAAAAVSCLLAACGSGGGDAAPAPSDGGGTSTSRRDVLVGQRHHHVRRPPDHDARSRDDGGDDRRRAGHSSTHRSAAATSGGDGPSDDRATCTLHRRVDPPADAANLKATYADVDADGRIDVLWMYDAADGTHLQVRTGRGATDNVVLGYGTGAVAVGSGQVDLALGSADPGTPQEILAVTSAGDARRLVGVYGFAIATGCLQSFTFDQGNPFVYLISRQGTLSGLRCVNDGVNGHLEGFTASPAAGDAFTTNHLVFGRQVNTRRLVPVSFDSGTLAAPRRPGRAGPRQRHHRLLPLPARLLIGPPLAWPLERVGGVHPRFRIPEPRCHLPEQSRRRLTLTPEPIEAKRRSATKIDRRPHAGAPQRSPTHCRAKP